MSRPLSAAVLEGVRLHNEGRYFEAHEVLEGAWRTERDSLRLLYQGLLQLAVACHHHAAGHRRQTLTMLARARTKLIHFRPRHRGLAVDDLLHQMATFERLVREDAPTTAPSIKLAEGG